MSAVEGWITKRFDEIGTIFSGSTPSTSIHAFWNGEIVWVTPYDLSRLNSPYLSDSAKRITMKGLSGCSAHLLPAGSIVMSSRAPIGYVALPTVEFCTNQGCKSIQLKNNFTSEFTYYNILFNIDKVKNLGEGTTFAEISKTALSKIELDFPQSKPEQTKIAEILSTVDRAIEQTEALIAKQQRIKTGLMQDLLTRGIDEHGNLRSEQTHEFKDSPLGRIPVEWKVQGVTDICSEIFLGLTTKVDYVESGVPLIRAKDISTGRLLFEETLEISSRQHRELTKYRKARMGDMLISKSGTLGICALVDTDREFSIYESIIVMQPNTAICDSRFLLWLMRYDSTQRRLLGETVGSTVGHLNLLDFRKLKVPLPPEDEQAKIAISLGNFANNLEYDFQKLSKLKSLKTALMQDLLTGKKRVTALLNDMEVVHG